MHLLPKLLLIQNNTNNHPFSNMLTGWGSNRWNQLGSPLTASSSQQLDRAKLEPSLILENERFVAISAGDGHSLLVSETGDLVACGRGTEGQLGHGDKTKISGPRVVDHLQGEVIVDCAAGAMHSLAVTAAGKVYIWGLIHVTAAEQKKRDRKHAAAMAEESSSDEKKHLEGTHHLDERNESNSESSDDEDSEDTITDAAAAAGGDARQMLGLTGQASDKLLRIVMESTEKWMTASDAPTAHRRGEGFNDEEAAEEEEAEQRAALMEKERATERGEAGDLGMMKMDMLAQRRPVLLPSMVTGPLAKERVVAVSAGFGHSLALTERGTVFSSGYNDRGQLGLGHRVNCPTFQPITSLEGRIVVQIACGSQHNLLRVLSSTNLNHAECWVFGNGALGQLGLGRRVTGRRTPVRLPIFEEEGKNSSSVTDGDGGGEEAVLNVIDIAAGANHSVCVCRTNDGRGGIFSWGHGEYGQHGGQQSLGSNDLVDSFYYYSPRRLLPQYVRNAHGGGGASNVYDSKQGGEEESFIGASCGSCFTIGLTSHGNVWSWGWNAHGVLGRGRGLVSHAPMPIQTLGNRSDREASKLAVGGNHCLVLVSSSAAARAILLRPLISHVLNPTTTTTVSNTAVPAIVAATSNALKSSLSRTLSGGANNVISDTTLTIGGGDDVDDDAVNGTSLCDVVLVVQGSRLLAHRIILESRCRYLKGLFNAVERDMEEEEEESLLALGDDGVQENSSNKTSVQAPKPLEVSIDSEFVTTVTVRAMLIYLYTDVLECPPHRIELLRKLAVEYHLDRLVGLCISNLGLNQRIMTGYSNNSTQEESTTNTSGIPKSSFEEDMNHAVNSQLFADVLLYNSRPSKENNKNDDGGGGGGGGDTDSPDEVNDHQIWVHQCLVNHVEYFNTLLNGKYKEGKTVSASASLIDDMVEGGTLTTREIKTDDNDSNLMFLMNKLATSGEPSSIVTVDDNMHQKKKKNRRPYIKIDISGLIEEDGLNFATLKRLITFIYTGSASVVPENDPNAITELAATAERFGVITLVKICERVLVSLIDDVENAEACLDFAKRYNLRRLDQHCCDVLASQKTTLSSTTSTSTSSMCN